LEQFKTKKHAKTHENTRMLWLDPWPSASSVGIRVLFFIVPSQPWRIDLEPFESRIHADGRGCRDIATTAATRSSHAPHRSTNHQLGSGFSTGIPGDG
jgi:hypothetical protein